MLSSNTLTPPTMRKRWRFATSPGLKHLPMMPFPQSTLLFMKAGRFSTTGSLVCIPTLKTLLLLALLFAFGEHQGGYVFLPHLGLRVRLQPGDVVPLRGRVVPHQIEEWVGQRITIPHFTHSSLWRALGKTSIFEV